MSVSLSKPLVSVLIPAYNAAPWIDEAIESVLAQTYPNIEIIVVDDGSTDETLFKARNYETKGVKVFTQQNCGASAARNLAFKHSLGDFIQYLDADDLLACDKIHLQMEALKVEGERTISSSAWAMFTDKLNDAVFNPTELWTNFINPIDWLITAWVQGVWMQPSAWLTPRILIEEAGPWDERLSLHDDGEFFCRVLLKSNGVIFCPAARSYYRKGLQNSLSSLRSMKAAKSHYNICKLYEKHLLSYENSIRTQFACATNYQSFIYDHYPSFPDLRAQAALEVRRLGGTTVTPKGSPMFMKLKKWFGWKLAKKIEAFAYENKINRTALRNKLNLIKHNS